MVDEIKINAGVGTTQSVEQTNENQEDEAFGVSPFEQRQPNETALWKDKYARLFADLANTKKRLARTAAQKVEAEKETLLRDVLPVADGLDLAILHISHEADGRNFLQGIEMIRNILEKLFSKYEVKAIEALGKPFDPNIHEAIGILQHPEFPPQTVVKVQQKGYLYRDKLLRPAQVLVTPS